MNPYFYSGPYIDNNDKLYEELTSYYSNSIKDYIRSFYKNYPIETLIMCDQPIQPMVNTYSKEELYEKLRQFLLSNLEFDNTISNDTTLEDLLWINTSKSNLSAKCINLYNSDEFYRVNKEYCKGIASLMDRVIKECIILSLKDLLENQHIEYDECHCYYIPNDWVKRYRYNSDLTLIDYTFHFVSKMLNFDRHQQLYNNTYFAVEYTSSMIFSVLEKIDLLILAGNRLPSLPDTYIHKIYKLPYDMNIHKIYKLSFDMKFNMMHNIGCRRAEISSNEDMSIYPNCIMLYNKNTNKTQIAMYQDGYCCAYIDNDKPLNIMDRNGIYFERFMDLNENDVIPFPAKAFTRYHIKDKMPYVYKTIPPSYDITFQKLYTLFATYNANTSKMLAEAFINIIIGDEYLYNKITTDDMPFDSSSSDYTWNLSYSFNNLLNAELLRNIGIFRFNGRANIISVDFIRDDISTIYTSDHERFQFIINAQYYITIKRNTFVKDDNESFIYINSASFLCIVGRDDVSITILEDHDIGAYKDIKCKHTGKPGPAILETLLMENGIIDKSGNIMKKALEEHLLDNNIYNNINRFLGELNWFFACIDNAYKETLPSIPVTDNNLYNFLARHNYYNSSSNDNTHNKILTANHLFSFAYSKNIHIIDRLNDRAL